MKKISILFLGLFLFVVSSVAVWAYTYDITIPVKGKTIASEQLQKSSLFTIYSFALRVAEPSCQSFTIDNTKVLQAKKNGVWEENWTVKACKKTIDIPVKFTDTTYDIDPMKVRVTISK